MELQKRKTNRLKNYDYSNVGAYFITVCTKNREPFLSTITVVGDGSAVPQNNTNAVPQNNTTVPNIILTPFGQIVENHINMIPTKYPNTKIDAYVIMPDHVHMILSIVTIPQNNHGRANPAPTIGNIMGWFKYATTKQIAHCWNTSDNHFWQQSYYDHIIRNEQDYRNICQYINENPIRWLQKHSHH